ncbi:hypothetical protein M422DRAFT_259716 [Sphaerobolus stellatus SS14]|uniref:Uncharacterized protein n=1 Tax=Sphaerobolus stellatus (strain SS14) TaxID=990650 RepID=A0A0C9V8K3_SPHS4|nr:hypothetical protein M422DRAFT_259716 [Sphaerobolus stellatus SS14]
MVLALLTQDTVGFRQLLNRSKTCTLKTTCRLAQAIRTEKPAPAAQCRSAHAPRLTTLQPSLKSRAPSATTIATLSGAKEVSEKRSRI